MATSPINKLFGRSDVLSRLQDHAELLLRLQRKLEAALPLAMRDAVHVANFQDGELTLHAESPALATRLKMSQETLKNALQVAGENVLTIKTKVRTNPFHGNDTTTAEVPDRQIGAEGKSALRSLGESLSPEDPLALALQRMLDKSR